MTIQVSKTASNFYNSPQVNSPGPRSQIKVTRVVLDVGKDFPILNNTVQQMRQDATNVTSKDITKPCVGLKS